MEDLSKYKGNSHSAQKPDAPRKKVEQIVSTPPTESKPGLGERLKALFVGEDARSVGDYLLIDVVVPATKDLIFDLFTEGASRSLYGDNRGRPSSRGNSSPRKSYSAYYQANRGSREPTRERDDSGYRTVHDFSNLRFPNAGEAEAVVDGLRDLIAEYGVATVNDFYDSIGRTGDFTDDGYGWDESNFRGAIVRRVRDGYRIELPRPKPIDTK